MHGGGAGSGAPKGNRNRLLHGFYSAAARAERRRFEELYRAGERLLREIDGDRR